MDLIDIVRLFDMIKKIVKDEEGDVEVCELILNVIYVIDGLDCVNCVVKIEEKLNKIEGILGVNVDFIVKKLIF